jgi:hypothetical protein
MGDFQADRLYTPKYPMRAAETAPRIKGYSGMPNHALNFVGSL